VSLGFTIQAAKLISYYRACITANGGYCDFEDWMGAKATLVGTEYSPGLAVRPYDYRLFRLADLSWPVLVLTALGAFLDSGFKFTDSACKLAKVSWSVTEWRSLLKEVELSWPQVFQYVIRVFSPRALVIAITHRVLAGAAPGCPILDVAHHSETNMVATSVMAPWAPGAGGLWWQACRHRIMVEILERRAVLRELLRDGADQHLSQGLTSWATADLDPLVDAIRIAAPVVLTTLRPMYEPPAYSTLYLSPNANQAQVSSHAFRFAAALVSTSFGQEVVEASAPNFTKMPQLPADRLLLVYAPDAAAIPGLNPDKQLVVASTTGPGSLPLPAIDQLQIAQEEERQTPQVATAPLVAPHVSSSHAPVLPPEPRVTNPFSEAYIDAHWEEPGLGSEPPPPPPPKRRPAPMPPKRNRSAARAVDSSTAQVAADPAQELKAKALEAAKRKLVFETYSDEYFEEAMASQARSSWFSMFWKPELTEAKTAYDAVMDSG